MSSENMDITEGQIIYVLSSILDSEDDLRRAKEHLESDIERINRMLKREYDQSTLDQLLKNLEFSKAKFRQMENRYRILKRIKEIAKSK